MTIEKQNFLDMYANGFCVLPSVYDAAEQQAMRDLLDAHWRAQGSKSLGEWGFPIHPLAPKIPELLHFIDRPLLLDALSSILQDEAKIVHLGARLSDVAATPSGYTRIEWHHHYAWDSSKITQRDRIERILFGIYVDGTLPEVGPLVALPRKFNDPIGDLPGPVQGEWPGERKVEMPPGSIVIFDTAMWHSALTGQRPGMRRLWGAHVQGWSNPRPHPEDNPVNVPAIADALKTSARLRNAIAEPPVKS